MLKRLRLKFVCITMSIVTVMLCVILGTVLYFTAKDMELQSMDQLRSMGPGPVPGGRPGEQKGPPLFALEKGPEDDIHVIGGNGFNLEDEKLLEELMRRAEAGKGDSGVLPEYDLRYYRDKGKPGDRVLFVDISGQRQTLEHLALNCVLIGTGSFCVLLVASILLARWAIKPVESAWKEQRQFVADASHELKTPLTVILTSAEMLEENTDPKRNEQLVEGIQSMSRQMRGLVESLLELARVDDGAIKQEFREFSWSDAVSDAVLLFEPVFFEAGLTLNTQIQNGIQVKGSCRHLIQVVDNLLDNAKKYAAPGTEVTLSLKKNAHRECLLQVSNWGEPIAPEDLKNLFKRFYRADKARTMNQSYGLGLSIAQSIVSDHGGKIWAQSKDGINSFFVSLNTI